MLEHLGEREAAGAIVAAVETVLTEPALRTRDLGGSASTEACGKAIADAIAGPRSTRGGSSVLSSHGF